MDFLNINPERLLRIEKDIKTLKDEKERLEKRSNFLEQRIEALEARPKRGRPPKNA